jgi:hypothetical protein
MMNRTIAATLALLLGTASIACAQTTTVAPAQASGTARADQNDPAKPFSPTEMDKIAATLSSKGYTAPTNVRRHDDGYLVTAMKDTISQEVWVDPQSGIIKTMSK